MSAWGRAASAATAAALLDPTAWLVALAGFLVRGGVVVVLLPILVLPTTTGVATVVGPSVMALALGSAGPTMLLVAAGAIGVALAWLVVGGLIGAATDAWLIRRFADGTGATGATTALRVLAVRVVASLPLAGVIGWAVLRVVDIVYTELVTPSDVSVSLALRVLRAAPEIVPAIVVAWLVAEVVASLAARHVVLGKVGAGRGLVRAVGSVLRHPAAVLATLVAWISMGLVVAGPAVAAATLAWDGLRTALLGDAQPLRITALALVFSGLWLGALALIGLAGAWGSALWTHEVRRWLRPVAEARPSEPPVAAVPTESVRAA